ncbi:hypothetical protein ES703_62024 [subsurface metagenome]
MQNNDKKLMLGNIVSFAQLESLVFEFENVLREYNITITSGSDLERVCLSVIDVLGKKKQPHLMNPLEDIRPYFSDILGLWVFMTKIVGLRTHCNFIKLVPHLELLNIGTAPQNKKSPITDQAANKIFELLIALLCMEIGENISLDHPGSSKGNNPDIIFTFEGLRWGFACKVPHTISAKSIYDNITTGINQVEASPVDLGCVVLNFKNLIDHNYSWPILNETEVSTGKVPIFGAWANPISLAKELV